MRSLWGRKKKKKRGSTTGAADSGAWTGAARCHVFAAAIGWGGGGLGLAEANLASFGGGRERKSNEVNVKRYEGGIS